MRLGVLLSHGDVGNDPDRLDERKASFDEGRTTIYADTAMGRTYIRVAVVWVITLAVLYLFQAYFTR